jgi:hypothetical protein
MEMKCWYSRDTSDCEEFFTISKLKVYFEYRPFM